MWDNQDTVLIVDVLNVLQAAETVRRWVSERSIERDARLAVRDALPTVFVNRFGQDALFVASSVSAKADLLRLVLSKPDPERDETIQHQFAELYGSNPDRVSGQLVLRDRVTAFIRDVDGLLATNGLYAVQVLHRRIEDVQDGVLAVPKVLADLGDEIVVDGARTRDALGTQMAAGFEEMLGAIANQPLSHRTDVEAEVRQKLDALRKVASFGRIEVATEVAGQLLASSDVFGSHRLAAEVRGFIGGNRIFLDEVEHGLEDLESALTHKVGDEKLRLRTAGANLLAGNYSRAAELAEGVYSEGLRSTAHGILLQARYWLFGPTSVDELLAIGVDRESLDVALALGHIYRHEGRYRDSERAMRPHMPSSVDSVDEAQVAAEFGTTLLAKASEALQATVPPPWLHPEEVTKALKESIAVLSQAIDYLVRTDYRTILAICYSNRGTASSLIGDFESAYSDFRSALNHNQNSDVYGNMLRNLLLQERLDEAVRFADGLPDSRRNSETWRLLGDAHLLSRNARSAVEAYLHAVDLATKEGDQRLAQRFLASAYLHAGNQVAFRQLFDRLREVAEEDSLLLAHLGGLAFEAGDRALGVELYDRALRVPEAPSIVPYLYGKDLYFAREWQEAADQYANIYSPSADPAVVTRYCHALYLSGSQAEALRVAKVTREVAGVSPGLIDVEAQILMSIGDTVGAVPLLKQLYLSSDGDPERLGHLCRALILDFRFDEARAYLSTFDWRLQGRSPEAQLKNASLMQLLGLQGYERVAYEAYRSTRDDPSTCLGFIQIVLLSLDGTGWRHSLSQVTEDSVVALERADESVFYVTVLAGRSDLRSGEVSAESKIGKSLIGRAVGDQLFLGVAPHMRSSVRVKSIEEVVSGTARNLMLEFQERFPGEVGVVAVSFDSLARVDVQFSDQLKTLDRGRDALEERYANDPHFPFHTLAKYAWGLGMQDARDYARRTGIVKIRAFDGRLRHAHDQRLRASLARRIVIDDSSILTLSELGVLDRIHDLYEEVIATKRLLWELQSTIYMHTGRVDEGSLPETLVHVQSAIDWLREKATLMPATARLQMNATECQKLDDLVGPVGADSILIARAEGIPLLTDDFGLSLVASANRPVRATNTFQCLQRLGASRVLSLIEYAKHLATLSRWRYQWISVSGAAVAALVEHEEPLDDFSQLVTELGSEGVDIESSLAVAAEATWQILQLRKVNYKKLLAACREILDVLVAHLSPITIASYMVAKVLKRRMQRPAEQAIYLVLFSAELEHWYVGAATSN